MHTLDLDQPPSFFDRDRGILRRIPGHVLNRHPPYAAGFVDVFDGQLETLAHFRSVLGQRTAEIKQQAQLERGLREGCAVSSVRLLGLSIRPAVHRRFGLHRRLLFDLGRLRIAVITT